MSTPSDPRTLVMHGLRLKGFAEAAAVGEAVGVAEADAKPVLDQLVVDGLATYRDGKLSGFSLTKAGPGGARRGCWPAELDAPGARDAVDAAYRRFLELNTELLDGVHRVAAPRRRRRVHRQRPQPTPPTTPA